MLRVVQLGFQTDPQNRAPAELLQHWPTLVDVADCAHGANVHVSVIQSCATSQRLTYHGVEYYFLPLNAASPSATAALGTLLGSLAPDALHVHGLGFPRDVLSLAALAPGVPIVLQDHANRPPRMWRRALWRRAFAAASGVAFCSAEQAAPFRAVELLPPEITVYEIPESTSRFRPGNREQARARLGVCGDPMILMVGHLNENKDPLTVIKGIERAMQQLPKLQLYCGFGTAPLLGAVERRLACHPALQGRVHLLGRVPHATVEQLMQAADVFVSGSHRESTGYSLIEALACGLPSLVTDIPSFRSITGGGGAGGRWPTGDAQALCDGLLTLAAQSQSTNRIRARARFEQALSFEAVGRQLASMYHRIASLRTTR